MENKEECENAEWWGQDDGSDREHCVFKARCGERELGEYGELKVKACGFQFLVVFLLRNLLVDLHCCSCPR